MTVVGGEVHDFGAMRSGGEGEHRFVIRNDGGVPLTLRIGASTCKCTVGELDVDSVPPGEEAEVRLSWTVKTNQDQFSQMAEVITNDPESPAVQLRVQGRVLNDYVWEPEALTIGSLTPTSGYEGEAVLYVHREGDYEVAESGWSDPEIGDRATVEVSPLPRGAFASEHRDAVAAYRVRFSLPEGLPEGSLNKPVRLVLVDRGGEDEGSAENARPDDNDVDAAVSGSDRQALLLPVRGEVVAALRLVSGRRVKRGEDGRYSLNLGRTQIAELPLDAETLIMVKGDVGALRVEKTEPAGLAAQLGEPKTRGSLTMVPLSIRIDAADPPDENGSSDGNNYFGRVVVAADNEPDASLTVDVRLDIESDAAPTADR